MTIPVCIITGRIAGDADACGDCDPCSGAHYVPEPVKRLLAEKEEWRQKYSDAVGALSEIASERPDDEGHTNAWGMAIRALERLR